MSYSKILSPGQIESLTVYIFFVVVIVGLQLYADHINATTSALSLVTTIPLLLAFTLPSRVLSVYWKIISVFLAMVITALYFGVSWPQRYVLGDDGYYTIVNDSVGLSSYTSFVCIIALLFLFVVLFYKVKVKKTAAFD
ncbi:hypothetical protein MmiEs2_08150 [Methanimicrococcus stummii]|uniref:Uncharacterized protein n=2 Tax=Methanimicrococcus stummii TaxID=3028294 RepID=A0AA96V8N2_9EURY|nr:hypothetical protein MmiEs2_08150 [Methanimicrococcus sp. Es2]